ncbi:FAD-linked oxidase C-terminal domain-containing protein [Legionella shakespearei]
MAYRDSLHYDLVEKIKKALDPNNILSPGRYHPLK